LSVTQFENEACLRSDFDDPRSLLLLQKSIACLENVFRAVNAKRSGKIDEGLDELAGFPSACCRT
jgi:hypothetical protein